MATDINTTSDDRIGGYRYIRTIHPGHTSVVMEVLQEGTQRRFALKQLLASRAEDRDDYRAFVHEARLGMELRHPNLIRVYEFVKDRVQPYFVMELFSGHHMKLSIARPSLYPLPKTQLHRIVEQAAPALSYMHEQGLGAPRREAGEHPVQQVGRGPGDRLRPGQADGERLLQDLQRQGPAARGRETYISPEQIRCEPPSPSSDIYSFGITCYELACGRPPFRANSSQELLQKHMSEKAIPLTNYNKRVTPEFNDLIMKMIQKKAGRSIQQPGRVPVAIPLGPDLPGRPRPAGGQGRDFS